MINVQLEHKGLRIGVIIQPKDLHTNACFQLMDENDKKSIQEHIQHALRMLIIRLESKHDLSKVP